MTWELIVTPAAERDIAEAMQWYESNRPGFSIDFRESLDTAFEMILRHPEAFTFVARGVRRMLLHRFPYGVFYRFREQAIQVVGVIDTRRDPSVWQGRAH